MSRRNGCSHCGRKGHFKPKCPDINRPAAELEAERQAEWDQFYSAANEAAKILGRFPPERRVHLAKEAFDRAGFEFQRPIYDALLDREKAAKNEFKAVIEREQETIPASAPKKALLN